MIVTNALMTPIFLLLVVFWCCWTVCLWIPFFGGVACQSPFKKIFRIGLVIAPIACLFVDYIGYKLETYVLPYPYPTHFNYNQFYIIVGLLVLLFVYLKREAITAVLEKKKTIKTWVIGMGIGGVFLYFFGLSMWQYMTLNVADPDFSSTIQLIWKSSEWITPYTTIFNRHLLANHWSPIFMVLGLVYNVIPHPLMIVGLTIGSALLGLYWIYKTAQLNVSYGFLSLSVVVAIMMLPHVQGALVNIVNPDVYGFMFMSMAIYGFFSKRRRLMWIGLIGGVLCKEDIPLYYAAFGAWISCYTSQKRFGMGLCVGMLCLFGIILGGLMPYFSQGDMLENLHWYGYLGDSFGSILTGLVLNLHLVILNILAPSFLANSLFFLAPLVMVFVLGRSALWLCVMPFVLKGLNLNSDAITFANHHVWHPLAWVSLSCIVGIKTWVPILQKRTGLNPFQVKNGMALTLLLTGFFYMTMFSEYNVSQPVKFKWEHFTSSQSKLLKEALSYVPEEAALLADNTVLSYTPNRRQLLELNTYHDKSEGLSYLNYHLSDTIILDVLSRADYCVLDKRRSLYDTSDYVAHKERLVTFLEATWTPVMTSGSVVVFTREGLDVGL